MGFAEDSVRRRSGSDRHEEVTAVYKGEAAPPGRENVSQRTSSSFVRTILVYLAIMTILYKLAFAGLGFLTTLTSAKSHHVVPTAAVKNGTYAGVYSAKYDQDFFLGIPYAQVRLRMYGKLDAIVTDTT